MNILDTINQQELAKKLKDARNVTGFTQEEAAGKLGFARTTLVAIESGDRRIKPEELIAFSRLYSISANQLLQPKSIQANLIARFRKYKPNEMDKASSEAMRILNHLATAASEIESLLGKPLNPHYPPEVPIMQGDIVAQAEDAATIVRHQLGLGTAPVSRLDSILEWDLKIRVFVRPLSQSISGLFAYDEALGACILLNQRQSKKRQLITIAHEWGHFISSRADADIWDGEEEENSKEEKFAVAFSVAVTMPAISLRRRYREICDSEGKFSVRRLILLAQEYYVTEEAMCRRLEGLKLLPAGTFDSLKERGLSKVVNKVNVEEEGQLLSIERPSRISLLAAEVYQRGLLSESQLCEMLMLDRVQIRRLLDLLGEDEHL